MVKAKPCWVILAVEGSCLVSAVYLDKKEAEAWVKKRNKELGFAAYYIEQSQLIGGNDGKRNIVNSNGGCYASYREIKNSIRDKKDPFGETREGRPGNK